MVEKFSKILDMAHARYLEAQVKLDLQRKMVFVAGPPQTSKKVLPVEVTIEDLFASNPSSTDMMKHPWFVYTWSPWHDCSVSPEFVL